MQDKHTFKRILFFLVVLSIGSATCFVWVKAASDTILSLSDQTKKALSDKQDALDAIEAKIKAYKQIVDLKQRQGATLNDQIDGLQAQADKLQLEIDLTTQKIDDLKNQIDSLSNRIAEKSVVIDRQKKMLSELMRIYYSDYTNEAAPLFLTSAESLLYFKTEDWTTDVSLKVTDILDSVKTLRDSLASEHTLVNQKKAEVDALYKDLDERNTSLEATKRNKSVLLAKTQSEEQKYSGLVDQLKKQREELESEIEDLETGRSTDGLPSARHGMLGYPVSKVSISQGYGKTSYSGRAYASGKHNGVDFTGAYGTPILAAASGRVIGTGNLGKYAYGRWAAIDHGNGIVTLYGHMSSVGVSKGEKVNAGETIGKMGSTGYSTGNHVHFTVYSAKSYELVPSSSVKGLMIPVGATANPMNYLPQ